MKKIVFTLFLLLGITIVNAQTTLNFNTVIKVDDGGKYKINVTFNWEEWIPRKIINRDGTVSKFDLATYSGGRQINQNGFKFSFNGDYAFKHSEYWITVGNEGLSHSAFKFHHYENGNKVYFFCGLISENTKICNPSAWTLPHRQALVLSADGKKINLLALDNLMDKNVIGGEVYEKFVTDYNVGPMYE